MVAFRERGEIKSLEKVNVVTLIWNLRFLLKTDFVP